MSTTNETEKPLALDERGCRPSASGLHRLFACPNSWLLEQQVPKKESSKEAERGTKIHLAIERENTEGLTEDEREIYDDCLDIVVNKFIKVLRPEGEYKTEREERMWADSGLYSGKADVIFSWDDYADVYGENGKEDCQEPVRCVAIADYKTGNIMAEPVEENRQLQTLAALYWQKHRHEFDGVWFFYAAIIQPLCTHSPKILTLSVDDLEAISEENDNICKAAMEGGGSYRVTTHGCRYCSAKCICPAMREKVKALAALNYDEMTNEQKEDAYIEGQVAISAINGIMDKVKQEVISAHDEGRDCPFTKLKYKNGSKRTTISDARKAIEAIEAMVRSVQGADISTNILDYATISKTGVEKFVRQVLRDALDKDSAKVFLSDLMKKLDEDGLFSYNISSPSVMLSNSL